MRRNTLSLLRPTRAKAYTGMQMMISGYIVVRKTDSPGSFNREYPVNINEIFYQGFERDAFWDISLLHTNGKLSNPYLEYYLEARDNDNGFSEYVADYSVAQLLLDYSNNISGPVNEIIAFEMNSKPKLIHSGDLIFLGIDIYFYAGSLLYEGIFAHPNLFQNFQSQLTTFGLLPNEQDIIDSYINDYCLLSENHEDCLEPATKNDIKDIVKIWRVG